MFDHVTDIETNREKKPEKIKNTELRETLQMMKLWKWLNPLGFLNITTLFLKI